MSGNITKEGIKADLEWMKRVGIGGFQNFDAGLNTPQIVEKRLVYMTPEWKDAFKYAATLADQLGLEMAIAGSPGWSESGGPWVTPAQAMKKYVWSETRVEGGRPFTGVLPKPPSTTGPYQNQGGGRGGGGMMGAAPAASARVLCRQRGGGLSPAGRRAAPRIRAAEGDFQRRQFQSGRTHRRRPRQVHSSPGCAGRIEGLDSVRISRAADRPGTHLHCRGRRRPGFWRPRRRRPEQPGTGSQRRRPAVSRGRADSTRARAPSSIPPVTARFFRVTIRTPSRSSRRRRAAAREEAEASADAPAGAAPPRAHAAPACSAGRHPDCGTGPAWFHAGEPVSGKGRLFGRHRNL